MDLQPQYLHRKRTPAAVGTLPLAGPLGCDQPPPSLGGYQLGRQIGVGATGRVFVGESADGKRCAVKLARRAAPSSFAARRFELEARVLESVRCPAVVRLVAGPRHEGAWSYHLLELIGGESLDCAFAGALPPRDVLRLVLPIAEALAAVHAAGWVHGDVKPANALIALDGDGSWRVKLVDLGSAQAAYDTDDAVSSPGRFGLVCGSPAYMSPEQAAGRAIDARTDVYAFGLLVYELLTGRPRALRDGGARALPDCMPCSWRALLVACLRDDPALRPQSMSAVIALLRSTMQDGPAAHSRTPRAVCRASHRRAPSPPTRPQHCAARLGA